MSSSAMASPASSPPSSGPSVGGEEDSVLSTTNGDCSPVTKATRAPLPNVKDKGYAWVVIAVLFLSNVITTGYLKTFGIIYNEISNAYPGTSATSGGVLIALMAGCRSVLSPFVGALGVRYGYRLVMMFGVLLSSTGLFFSYFCNSVSTLAVPLGVMMGVGMCSTDTCQVLVLADYFQDKKELANSIMGAGIPFGGMVLPFFLVLLFEYFGLRLSYIILSALFLQLSGLIFLIRPYKIHQKIVNTRRLTEQNQRSSVEESFFELPPSASEQKEISKLSNTSLLTNPLYLTLLAMTVGFALPMPEYFISLYCKSIGWSPEQISAILVYQSIWDSVIILAFGYMLNKKLFKKTTCFIISCTVGGIATTLFPFTRGFWGVSACILFSSFAVSGYYATVSVMLLDLFGRNNVASSSGFIKLLHGLLKFVFPPLLGLLVDVSGGYFLTFLAMGAGMLFAAFCIAMLPLVARAAGIEVTFK